MFWSFENADPRVEMAGYHFSFQVFTGGKQENTYSLDAKSIKVKQEGNRWLLTASRLSWPGQQRTAPGSFEAEATLDGDAVILRTSAQTPGTVRTIKVRIHALADGLVAQTGWQVVPNFGPITAEGTMFSYPRYTSGSPVWFVGQRDNGISFSALDVTTAPKRFCAYKANDGVEVQLIAEQDAPRLSTAFSAPAWEIRRNTTLEHAIAARTMLLEKSAGLKPWSTRDDVAPWARKVSLVVTLHGMHWSGYIFNDYARMLETVQWVCDRIPGERVLFFLAGWEGRYYRQYGDSRPDDQMGGADGLRRLVRAIHAKGAHVMAMFAGNAAGPTTPNLAELSENSKFKGLPGSIDASPMRGYKVDWAEIRADAGGGGAWLNPGASGWREHLVSQVSGLNADFGFDGNFFDTQPNMDNDFLNNPLEGLRKLADELRAKKPELLLATETWYDLSLAIIPCSQTMDGPGHWSRKYQRRFAHVSLGEPSRGSTGVHEVGHVPWDLPDLLETFDLPTLAIVDGTIRVAPQHAEAVITAAKKLSEKSSPW
jgi:hypothetical protein